MFGQRSHLRKNYKRFLNKSLIDCYTHTLLRGGVIKARLPRHGSRFPLHWVHVPLLMSVHSDHSDVAAIYDELELVAVELDGASPVPAKKLRITWAV